MADGVKKSGHPVDEMLSVDKLATFGLQHVLVMYAGTMAILLILGSALGLTQTQIVTLINADLFTCGIATLIQTIGIWKFGGRWCYTAADGFIPQSWRYHSLCA